jgi:hypothetical protein
MKKPSTFGLLAQAFVLTVMLGGCATPKAVGKGATEGAMEEVREQSKPRGNEPPPVQEVASNVIKGTLVELDNPETRAQLSRIIGTATQSAVTSMLGGNANYGDPRNNAARGWGGGPTQFGAATPMMAMGPMGALGGRISEGFTLGMSRQLQIELGEDGQGPLGQSLAGVIKQATQAAVSGAAQELGPLAGDCAGMDRQRCADMRVQELSRSAANGFVQGLGAALQLPLMVVAFASGLVIAIVAALLFSWLRRRPRPAAAIS